MRRNFAAFASTTFDLLVVGGGIYGACVAWDAALRGLSVALIEQGDWGGATSANSMKTIHGGLRYLQHGDIRRVRESIGERRALMRIAPHLVHPLPVLLPTYGHGLQGRAVMSAALLLNDLLSCDRNHGLPPAWHIPAGQVVSRDECLRLAPGVDERGLSGAAIFYDAQARNSERLTLAFVRSAAERGALVANYLRATSLVRERGRVAGVTAEDTLCGEQLVIRARAVVNAAGPWCSLLPAQADGPRPAGLALAVNLVTRPLFDTYAVGVAMQEHSYDSDALVDKGRRLLFVAPWRGRSILGTAYALHDGSPNRLPGVARLAEQLLADFNRACPGAALRRADVDFVHAGLLPIVGVDPRSGAPWLAKRPWLRDHRADGAAGLVSVQGVKYTTARQVASQAVEAVFRLWGRQAPRSRSAHTPLFGGQLDNLEALVREAQQCGGLDEPLARRLVLNHGAAYAEVLGCLDGEERVTGAALLRAEVRHAARHEMALTLADVVFRRTELGSAGHPGAAALRIATEAMAEERSWNREQVERELDRVNARFAQGTQGTTDDAHQRAELAAAAV